MSKSNSEVLIQPQYEITSGIDVHKDIIVTYIGSKDGRISEIKEWNTFTKTLHELASYLKQHKVEACLMESTGIYWISLYHILTSNGLHVIVSNPQHIKQMPKRKTDKKDAKWLCTLVMNGLVRKSLIPDEVQFEFRECCRVRDKYRRLITQANNRVVRILERANIKIRSVASSIRTKTCQEIIGAIIDGVTDPDQLANMCKGRLRPKMDQMRLAVQGKLTRADTETLQMLRDDITHYKKQLSRVNERIDAIEKEHYAKHTERLDEISGIGKLSAQQIIAEIGTQMEKFATADHLTSWAGLAPGNHQSAGKTKNTSTKKGNKHLRSTMITVAWGAVRTKGSYWSYTYAYFKSKMPSKKAIVVIARKMLKLVYKTLKEDRKYVEGGKELFFHYQNQRSLARKRRKSVQVV